MKKIITFLVMLSVFAVSAQPKKGAVKGVVTDDSGEAVPFANVMALQDGAQVLGTTTDFDGKYTLKPLDPGVYQIQFSFVGYQTTKIENVIVSPDKLTELNGKLHQGVDLSEVVIEYERPVFEKDQTTSGTTRTRSEIRQLACRSVADIVKIAGNRVVSRDNGAGRNNVRGSRVGSSVTFIDGVKVIGTNRLPTTAIEEVTVKTGGVPAQYENADKASEIVEITTSTISEALSAFSYCCLLYTSPSPRDKRQSRMPSSA